MPTPNQAKQADREDRRSRAVDALTVAALQMQAPAMVQAYLDDALPLWLERQLHRAITAAQRVAERSGGDDDTSFLTAYAEAIGPLIAMAVETVH
jgi:hypothetical protein